MTSCEGKRVKRRRIYQTDWNRNDGFLTVLVDADAKLTTHADLALTSGSCHRAEVWLLVPTLI
jgi:hypothetical protein